MLKSKRTVRFSFGSRESNPISWFSPVCSVGLGSAESSLTLVPGFIDETTPGKTNPDEVKIPQA